MTALTPLALLRTWCDGLLAHQLAEGPEAGGIFCPSHQIVHGRCGDATYPLLALFARTGEEKYRTAARAVYAWSERRVSQPDGSWTNEADGRNSWRGISCFSVISLGEALRHHGDTLDPAEREVWRTRLRRGADFVAVHQTFELGDINYPFSAAAALALAGVVLDEPRHLARARELITFSLGHFTANQLVWGEGQRGPDDLSPCGLRPIDLPYNVAESLPSLALYAELTHDASARDAAVASLRSHLAWMLPDGAWDAGWCTRLAKWTYASSRTTDGCAGGFALLRAHDLRFAEAAHRNLRLLAAHTREGLLGGGPHVHARGLPVCSHPTFAHARGLAIALDAGLPDAAPGLALPSDHAQGLREWPEAGVTQIALGPWRASVTINDIPSTPKRGGHPSGGSLAMLWHERAGPLLVPSMNDYLRYEGVNMDEAHADTDKAVLTPRIEARLDGSLYSSVYEGRAELASTQDGESIHLIAHGVLRDVHGQAPPDSSTAYELHYRFTSDAFVLTARCATPAVLHVPLVAPASSALETSGPSVFTLHLPESRVRLLASAAPVAMSTTERVFNFVPGVQAAPFLFDLTPDLPIEVRLEILR